MQSAKEYYKQFKNYCHNQSFTGATKKSKLLDSMGRFLSDDEIDGFYFEHEQQEQLIVLAHKKIFNFLFNNNDKDKVMHEFPLNSISDIKFLEKPDQISTLLIKCKNNYSLSLSSVGMEENEVLMAFTKELIKDSK